MTFSKFIQILCSLTPNDYRPDNKLMCTYIRLPVNKTNSLQSSRAEQADCLIIDGLLNAHSRQQKQFNDDDVKKIFKTTATANIKTNPLKWWNTN